MPLPNLESLADAVVKSVERPGRGGALLVGVSGIDASGKGHVAERLYAQLCARGLRTALINADAWLNLPRVRFSESSPALHFYENALQLDELFERLLLPLKEGRSIRLAAELTQETAEDHHRHTYEFDNIDVILVEGIFLFKPRFTRHFDLKIWVDCGFATALQRAVARSQEGLEPADTVRAYEAIYFPAQLIHLERDHPRSAADFVFLNDGSRQASLS